MVFVKCWYMFKLINKYIFVLILVDQINIDVILVKSIKTNK